MRPKAVEKSIHKGWLMVNERRVAWGSFPMQIRHWPMELLLLTIRVVMFAAGSPLFLLVADVTPSKLYGLLVKLRINSTVKDTGTVHHLILKEPGEN